MTDRHTSFIEQLFNAINNDPTMPADLKISLLRLQLPIHNLSLSDPHFLSNDKHPARIILYTAKKLSNYAKQDSDLIKKIEHITTELTKSRPNAQNFASANQRLESLLVSLQTHENNEHKKPTTQTSTNLKTYLNNKIKLCIQGHQIPNSCKVLVFKLWPSALYHLLQTHGEKTRHWSNAIEMYCELIESMQPIRNIDHFRQIKDNYMRIARSNNNMLLLYHDENKVELAIKALITHYNISLGNSNYGKAVDNLNKISILDKISSLPANVKPGIWCELFIDDATPKRRLKLSLINLETGMLVFVNRNGIKKLEKDALEFSEELKKGLSRTYNHSDLFGKSNTENKRARKIS